MSQLVPIREQVYRDPRPPEHFARYHARARTREPDGVYEVVRALTAFYSLLLLRARAIASDRVPDTGPVILAPNHSSFMDHFFVGAFVRRKVRFMAKSQLFKPPLAAIYSHGGVFPVRRGDADEAAFITAHTILERSGCLAMYCEGGRSRTGKVAETAKRGIGRLALESGAVVVPVAIHGSAKVRNWRRGQFPQITVHYGEPHRWEPVAAPTRDQQQAVADAILAEIRTLHDCLETVGRRETARRLRALRRTGSPSRAA